MSGEFATLPLRSGAAGEDTQWADEGCTPSAESLEGEVHQPLRPPALTAVLAAVVGLHVTLYSPVGCAGTPSLPRRRPLCSAPALLPHTLTAQVWVKEIQALPGSEVQLCLSWQCCWDSDCARAGLPQADSTAAVMEASAQLVSELQPWAWVHSSYDRWDAFHATLCMLGCEAAKRAFELETGTGRSRSAAANSTVCLSGTDLNHLGQLHPAPHSTWSASHNVVGVEKLMLSAPCEVLDGHEEHLS